MKSFASVDSHAGTSGTASGPVGDLASGHEDVAPRRGTGTAAVGMKLQATARTSAASPLAPRHALPPVQAAGVLPIGRDGGVGRISRPRSKSV